jgi:hypothetical protein
MYGHRNMQMKVKLATSERKFSDAKKKRKYARKNTTDEQPRTRRADGEHLRRLVVLQNAVLDHELQHLREVVFEVAALVGRVHKLPPGREKELEKKMTIIRNKLIITHLNSCDRNRVSPMTRLRQAEPLRSPVIPYSAQHSVARSQSDKGRKEVRILNKDD